MQRIASLMVGVMATSLLLELIVYPPAIACCSHPANKPH